MRHAEPSEIQALAESAAKTWVLADRIERIDLDIDYDSDERGFFRVIFNIKGLYDIPDEQLLGLTKSVEDILIERDDRFPSVRYADAAQWRNTIKAFSTSHGGC